MNLEKLRWAIFGCGAALFAAAVVGAWQEWASTGLWILVIAGGICLLIAFTADRLTGVDLDYGAKKIGLKLNALVRGDLKVTGLSGAAGTYSFIHNQLGNDPHLAKVKIKLQDDVVKMVRDNAFDNPVGEKEIDRVLSSGSPAERVLVFGLLEGDAKLATVDRLRQGIMDSRSGNEQFHAFKATLEHWNAFTEDQRKDLRKYVKEAPHYQNDPDRKELADKILGT